MFGGGTSVFGQNQQQQPASTFCEFLLLLDLHKAEFGQIVPFLSRVTSVCQPALGLKW